MARRDHATPISATRQVHTAVAEQADATIQDWSAYKSTVGDDAEGFEETLAEWLRSQPAGSSFGRTEAASRECFKFVRNHAPSKPAVEQAVCSGC